ncbi:MAG: glycosyltransferase family 39 protein [Candidatus Theseobacter exili]|nr:glycosyltransferase family 39 protein [Candidatus Theseobacter exili]
MKVSNNKYFILFSIFVFAVLLRIPGLFWISNTDVSYNYDENKAIKSAFKLSKGESFAADELPGSIVPLAVAIKAMNVDLNTPGLSVLFTGRIFSLLFSVFSILILFLIARLLFEDERISLASALLLSVSGLHVTYGHMVLPGSFTVCFYYLSIYFVLLSLFRNKEYFLYLSAFFAGAVIASNALYIGMIPVFAGVFAFEKKGKTVRLLVCVLTIVAGAFIFCSAKPDFLIALWSVSKRNFMLYLNSGRFSAKLNPFLFLIQLPLVLGLASFCLFLMGFGFFIKDAKSLLSKKVSLKLFGIIFFLPLFIHGIILCLTGPPFTRELLVFLPAACLVGGIALARFLRFRFIIAIIVIYQMFYVLSTEWFFVQDTREKARKWILNNSEFKNKNAYIHRASALRDIIKKRSGCIEEDPDVLILHETEYRQFVPNILNPFGNLKSVSLRRFSLPERWGFYKALFDNNTEFDLIKSFTVFPVSPELWLFKKVWGTFPSMLGDVNIFQKAEKLEPIISPVKVRKENKTAAVGENIIAEVSVINPDTQHVQLVSLGLSEAFETTDSKGGTIEWDASLIQLGSIKTFKWYLKTGNEINRVLSLYQKEKFWFFNPMNEKFGSTIGNNVYEKGSFAGLVIHAVPEDGAGFLMFGPFINLKEGKYKAFFVLKIEEMQRWGPVAKIEVASSKGNTVIEERLLRKEDVLKEGIYQLYMVPFSLEKDSEIEFRVYYMGAGDLYCEGVFLFDLQKEISKKSDKRLETIVNKHE